MNFFSKIDNLRKKVSKQDKKTKSINTSRTIPSQSRPFPLLLLVIIPLQTPLPCLHFQENPYSQNKINQSTKSTDLKTLLRNPIFPHPPYRSKKIKKSLKNPNSVTPQTTHIHTNTENLPDSKLKKSTTFLSQSLQHQNTQ